MTESEWLACTDPQTMLAFVNGATLCRKLRLFHLASCREALCATADERLLRAVGVAEQLAEGEPEPAEVSIVFDEIDQMIEEAMTARSAALEDYDAEVGSSCGCPRCEADAEAHSSEFNPTIDADFGYRLLEACWAAGATICAAEAVRRALTFPPLSSVRTERRHWTYQMSFQPTHQQLTELVREVFGNPFRPPVLKPSWLAWHDRCVECIAQQIYTGRRFGELPILADALEDAGCDNVDILNHCRQPGVHVRGCWVVDLLVGKK